MRGKVLIIDTSILCVWLKVRDMDTCGPEADKWDYNRVKEKIDSEKQSGTIFVLPLASIIETGNHIAHSNGDKKDPAEELVNIIYSAIDSATPWAAFEEQKDLWASEGLKKLVEEWRKTVHSKQSLADASIVTVANKYSDLGYCVEILTGDGGLKAYEPRELELIYTPRRRK